MLRGGGSDQPLSTADRRNPSLLLQLILENNGVDDVSASNAPPRCEADTIIQQIEAMVFNQQSPAPIACHGRLPVVARSLEQGFPA